MTVLMSLLSLAYVGIHNSSAAAADLTMARVEMQQRAREIVKRITPYLVSAAIPGPAEQMAWNLPKMDAVLTPPINTASNTVVFVTHEDYLTSDASSTTGWRGATSPTFNPMSPTLYLYRIQTQPDGSGTHQVVLQKLSSFNPQNVMNGTPTRVLARRLTNNTDVNFTKLSLGAVKIQAVTHGTTRGADRQRRATADYILDTIVQEPGATPI